VELNDDDDEAAWDGWDVESESGSESSEDEWHNVSDDDQDIVVSDSDDDEPKEEKAETEEAKPRISTLATTKVRARM